MAIQPVIPDILYLRNREDLISFEDNCFNALLGGLPNCYQPLTDYTLWGSLLRAIAGELVRIEYGYSYDLASLDPLYLTPPDIKRRWAAPLFINKSFPNQAQSDQDYKLMLATLIPAYRQGTTVEAIEAVVAAYTDAPVVVRELYRDIGNGIVDETYRNTIEVTVPASNIANPLSGIATASYLRTISEDLYAAIDLAKPAHVGLDYAVAFGTDENLQPLIAAITDNQVPYLAFFDQEPLPLEPVFTLSPFLAAGSPDTTLAAWGERVGNFFAPRITAEAWAALPAAFQMEYQAAADGSYGLNPLAVNDVALVDQNGAVTGAISIARGTLAPRLITSWEIKGDSLTILELD